MLSLIVDHHAAAQHAFPGVVMTSSISLFAAVVKALALTPGFDSIVRKSQKGVDGDIRAQYSRTKSDGHKAVLS